MAIFKQKPNKFKYLTKNETLDNDYKDKKKYFQEQKNKLEQCEKELFKLQEKLKKIDNSEYFDNYVKIRTELVNGIEQTEELIYDIKNGNEKIEFYSQVYDELFAYYNKTDVIYYDDENANDNVNDDINNNVNDNAIDDVNSNAINNAIDNDSNKNETNKELNKETNKDNKNISDSNIIDDDFLFSSSNILDKINKITLKDRKTKKTTRQRIKNIETLTNNSNKKNIFNYIGEEINDENDVDLATVYNNYKILLGIVNLKTPNNSNCPYCDVEKIQTNTEGIFTCPKCGDTDHGLVDNDANNYKEPVVEKPTSPYQRKNHFYEWLSSIQGKGTNNISKETMDLIRDELSKKGIVDQDILMYDTNKFREILKKLRLNKLYNNIAFIKMKLTGKTLISFTKDEEKLLKKMFGIIQKPYDKHCPLDRINFLSYPYVTKKFCELIKKMDPSKFKKNIRYLPILQRKKLIEHDITWKKMISELKNKVIISNVKLKIKDEEVIGDLKWRFIPSV